jgi:hypothetical protein
LGELLELPDFALPKRTKQKLCTWTISKANIGKIQSRKLKGEKPMNELKSDDVMPIGAVIEALELRAPRDAVCRQALVLLRLREAEIEWLEARLAQYQLELHCSTCREENARVEAITQFEERLLRFYDNLSGKTASGSVTYHIRQIAKELLEAAEKGG